MRAPPFLCAVHSAEAAEDGNPGWPYVPPLEPRPGGPPAWRSGPAAAGPPCVSLYVPLCGPREPHGPHLHPCPLGARTGLCAAAHAQQRGGPQPGKWIEAYGGEGERVGIIWRSARSGNWGKQPGSTERSRSGETGRKIKLGNWPNNGNDAIG